MSTKWTGAPAEPWRRRVLLLSPFAPRLDASMGGPLVIAQLIMALRERERPALLYLRGADEPPLDEEVRMACEFALETPRASCCPPITPGRKRHAVSPASVMTQGIPSWVAEWHEPSFTVALRSLVAGWQPHIVQAEFHLMGQYLAALGRSGPPTVLNQHEPGAAAAFDRCRSGLMPGRIVPFLEVLAWRRYEATLARQVDAIVTFTERDRKAMQSLRPTARVKVIAPGSAIPDRAADPLGIQPPALLFFGNYLHAPNVDAALRLARDIYPRLLVDIPDLRLWLPGDHAPLALTRQASERVVVPGRVPSLTPYLDSASMVVVPIRIGGGMRVKVLEALGAGKAVVASRRGLEGLDLADGEHALFADSDEDFARRVLWLVRHPEERAALAARARAWALQNVSWSRAAADYSALYDELLRETREATSGSRNE